MTLTKEITIQPRTETSPRTVLVEVTIDEEQLALRFGRLAGYNKTGRARGLRGAIKAKVVNRKVNP